MQKTSTLALAILATVAAQGCRGAESPVAPAELGLSSTASGVKGGSGGGSGGGPAERTFDVYFSGDISTSALGQVASVKDTDTRLHLPGFPMDDISWLRDHPALEGSETCFSDWQIGPDENIELLISQPKKGDGGEVGINYWFDGLNRLGEATLYRLVMKGSFTGDPAGWVGDATGELTTWSIAGQDGSGKGKPDRNACIGEGVTATTFVVDEQQ